MSNYTWTIEHSADQGSNWTDITSETQSWSYRYGRAEVTSQWSAGSASMTGWNPSALPTISVGDWIRFSDSTHGVIYVLGVADFSWVYNPAATADTWTMTLEDSLAVIGRGVFDSTDSVTGIVNLATVIAFASGFTTIDSTITVYSQDTSNNVSDLSWTAGESVQKFYPQLFAQGGAYVQTPLIDAITVVLYDAQIPYNDPYNVLTATNFDDDGTLSNGEPYQQIQFEGLSDAYFDQVFVNAAGLASQTAGSGERTYSVSTLHRTTAQADSWADYLLAQLSSKDPTPSVLVTSTTGWSTVANISPLDLLPGNMARVRLRSTTREAIIEGGIISATPEQTRFTLYLSDREVLNYLILDDAEYGQLDYNRLGY
jgi:hypothetical protein